MIDLDEKLALNDINDSIKDLESIQENLLDLIHSSTDPEELKNKIFEQAKQDKDNFDIYQTMLIAVSNVSTSNIDFKDKIIKLMNRKISKILFILYYIRNNSKTIDSMRKEIQTLKNTKCISSFNIPGTNIEIPINTIIIVPFILVIFIYLFFKFDPETTKLILESFFNSKPTE